MTKQVADTGMVPMPNKETENLEGGHCIIMIGYDNTTKLFQCVNSWGTSWGVNGIFYLPYDYVIDPELSCDFATLKF